MITVKQRRLFHLLAPILAVFLSACGGGSKSDFIEACLIEAGTSSAKDVAMCECGADAARASMSSDAFQVMVYEMAGKGAEAREISGSMSESEQMEMVQAVGEIFDRCALN